MGFTEALTLILITLKLTGVLHWSWWLVAVPEYPAVFGYLMITILIWLNVARAADASFGWDD